MARETLRERRQRRLAKQKKGMTLNIISLIDIFTVLVFFLLLNATEIERLPESKDIRLPESAAESRAPETVVVMVNRNDIFVQGALVAQVDAVLNSEAPTIPALKTALKQALDESAATAGAPRALTIMGDRDIPYRLLRKVLATCSEASSGTLSLAVLQKSGPVHREPET